jgi:LacI family transcriptional regulator
VRHIRQHACEGIGVEDVLDAVPVSRSTLERRFQALLGRSPREEILRVKLEHLRRLLRETDFDLDEIARIVGIPHAETLCALFRRETGQTPGAWRRAARP